MIGYVHPDEAIRDAAGGVEERLDQWRSGLARRDELAAAIRAYASTEEARSLEGARRRALELWLRDVRRGGHELEPGAKAEFGRLRDRVSELGVAFGRNLAEWSDEIVLGPGDLDGLSDSFVAQLPEGEAPGTRRLTMTYSVVFPFVEQSPRRDLREAALKKYYSRCAEINRPLIDEIVTTRRRLAGIAGVGLRSQFANEARMSGGRAA